MKKQTKLMSILEQIANIIAGILISYIVLTIMGINFFESTKFTFIFTILSFIRGYIIRRIFNRINT